MNKFWSRKRDIPKVCPRGHTSPSPGETLDDIFKSYFQSVGAVQVFDRFWKMYRWEFRCSQCSFIDSMKDNPFFKLMPRSAGRSMSVPITWGG